jgi:hypothetical protein
LGVLLGEILAGISLLAAQEVIPLLVA